jgi:hypothetical protein
MKSEEIIGILKTQIGRLEKLDGEDVGGFIIFPPEGQAVVSITVESLANEKSFYTNMVDKIALLKELSTPGGMTFPRGVR